MVEELMKRSKAGLSPLAIGSRLADLRHAAVETHQLLLRRAEEVEQFGARSSDLVERLYREALQSRMRPFEDGLPGLARMVRDMARKLGKQARLEIVGADTGVDREILERLESPLTHLVRNCIDHGLEPPEDRRTAGKPAEGKIRLEARHHSGQLRITVFDDGRGIDLDQVRARAVARGLVPAEVASRLSADEVFDFLFLPGFSTAPAVTEISGRGVGLDVVRSLAHEVGGSVSIESRPGVGSSVHLQLPVTLSVARVLLVEIGGDPYALPLARVARLAVHGQDELSILEGRRFVTLDGQSVGLVDGAELLGLGLTPTGAGTVSIVVVRDRSSTFGLVVDRFLGECKVVVRPLDPRLGKVRDVSAAALQDDGTLVLILDVDDLLRSIEELLSGGRLRSSRGARIEAACEERKVVLVADDSITVRELEKSLLANRGYTVHVAVDGIDALNCLRAGRYDLVVSDVDMPRLNGIELVRRIKADPRLSSIPVVIVSYKDREEDRLLGLEVGANHYLTKSAFHDETFLKTVIDLIGEP
jgi:two-component system sensor histidine kinase and response regulator WspE